MTKIEPTEQTWNPIVGCSIVSPGCTDCYAIAGRYDCNGYVIPGGHALDHYRGTTKPAKGTPVWTGKLALAPEKTLLEPLRRKKPTTYFVNSMGDLFHEDVPDEWIDRVFAVMALCPQHTFQVLTKRAGGMRAYMTDPERKRTIYLAVMDIADALARAAGTCNARPKIDDVMAIFRGAGPFKNVWLGVSAEDQTRADARIPDLLATPAAVRFVSAEPLIGPIDFTHIDHDGDALNALSDKPGMIPHFTPRPRTRLDWIIVGGESGPSARPMHPDWARSIRDQCQAASVPFFFKQWGEWTPGENVERQTGSCRVAYNDDPFDGVPWSFGSELLHIEGRHIDDEPTLYRVGKKAAGRLLDGLEWNEMPEASSYDQSPTEPAHGGKVWA